MRITRILFSVGLILANAAFSQESSTPPSADPPELVALQKDLAKSVSDAQIAGEKRRELLKTAYLNGIDTLQKQATQNGNLDAVLAAKSETERIGANQVISAAQRKALSPELVILLGRYEASLAQINSETIKAEVLLREGYKRSLQSLQTELTKRGKIDEALAVKKEREAQVMTPVVTAESLAAPSPAPPASTPPVSSPVTTPASFAGSTPSTSGTVNFFGVTVPPGTKSSGPSALLSATPLPAPPAATPQGSAKPGDIADVLVGKWMFTWAQNGWTAPRIFKSDGTFIGTGDGKGTGIGKWEVSGDKVIVNYPGGGREEMWLPLDPKGTKVGQSRKGRVLKAVKDN